MGISAKKIQTIIIDRDGETTLTSTFEEGKGLIDIEIQVGTEPASNISIPFDEAKILGEWLTNRAQEMSE